MGTTLIAKGLARGVHPEQWNVDHPEVVREIHRGYLEAGAQVILSNSFGGNRSRLGRHELEGRIHELNMAAAQLARVEADEFQEPVVVGGSIGPTGRMMKPLGDLTPEQAEAEFQEQAAALVEGGVDVLWIETMSDLEEVHAAVRGCRKVANGLPLVVTMTFDTHGYTSMGVSPEDALTALSGYRLAALGGNCGNGPVEIESVIVKLHSADPDVVLVAKSNAGVPRMKGGQTIYDAGPEVMAEHARRVYGLGARIIGACCGSTAEHISAMGRALKELTDEG
ncbi:MAG: methionine synthase [Anaerolineales bacterium]|nr:methionine synthase [Anaerolineales bacterium]